MPFRGCAFPYACCPMVITYLNNLSPPLSFSKFVNIRPRPRGDLLCTLYQCRHPDPVGSACTGLHSSQDHDSMPFHLSRSAIHRSLWDIILRQSNECWSQTRGFLSSGDHNDSSIKELQSIKHCFMWNFRNPRRLWRLLGLLFSARL